MLGLRRLGLDAIWLELLPATPNRDEDHLNVRHFQRQLRSYDLAGKYCLLYQNPPADAHEMENFECIGISRRELRARLAGPNVLLNLSNSFHPPFLLGFERRIFCDLDPSEVFYWMTKLEMGQSHHHEFCTIGLNVGSPDCRLPASPLRWRTFYPLVDCEFYRLGPAPARQKFATIGQWYWGGGVEVDGGFPDLSKKHAFQKYLDLPRCLPDVDFELAMNITADDPELSRLRGHGWTVVNPHKIAATPRAYRRYLGKNTGEFTAVKGVDVAWRTGWVSDRAAAFLATGRPVITEDTGAVAYLPADSGFRFVHDVASAKDGIESVLKDWPTAQRQARRTAEEVFDAPKNLRLILQM